LKYEENDIKKYIKDEILVTTFHSCDAILFCDIYKRKHGLPIKLLTKHDISKK